MLTLATTYTFKELMESAYRGAEDVLMVIAEYNKTEEFIQFAKDLGFEPLTAEELWAASQKYSRDEFVKYINTINDIQGFMALNDDLIENSTDWYKWLGIPVDEDGDPLPYKG